MLRLAQKELNSKVVMQTTELAKSEERFRLFMDNSPAIAWMKDEDGRHVYLSKTYEERFDVKLEDWRGKTDFELWPPQIAQEFRKNDLVVLEADHPIEMMEEAIDPDGSRSYWLSSKFSFRDASGKRYVAGMGVDITEKKKAEDALRNAYDEMEDRVRERTLELQKSNEKLQAEILERKRLEAQILRAQRMESIGTLAAGIAHDFNNILTPIILNATASLMDLPKDSPARKYQERIMASANRAKDLVQHILTYSRKGEHNLKTLNFQDVMVEALKLIRASIPSTIEIRQQIATSGPVLGDPTQMHQVVMNLCTNAYQAMRETGGILEITLDEVDIDAEFARPNINLRPGRYVRFTVKDTGHGMDEATMARIFDPFFTTKGTGGTGLGLSVVIGIVMGHGGDIDVQSQLGKGTTFNVYLPRAADEDKEAETKKEEAVPTGKERVLLVDDEGEIASIGKEMLERLGYDVIAKTDSLGALAEFQANPEKYDLVVTDYTMPNMNGIELAKELINSRPDIKIILTSGFNEAVTPEKLKMSGISSILKKPYAITDLAKAIRQVIDVADDQ